MILTQCTSQNVSRLSRRACCAVLPDKRDTSSRVTSWSRLFLCQNAWG